LTKIGKQKLITKKGAIHPPAKARRYSCSNLIKISELLGDAKDYGVYKEIRKAHNVYKMFIAGAFEFKKTISLNDYTDQIDFWHDEYEGEKKLHEFLGLSFDRFKNLMECEKK
jgi:hypothetical protein